MAKGSTSLIDPRYCCCAVPMVNAGIYSIIAEQTAVAVATAVLCFTAPSVPGVATPPFVTYIFAVVCLVGLAVQPVGFVGAFREKTKTFRVYSALNGIITLLAFIVAAAIIIVSAVRHDAAMAKCEKDYFTPSSSATQQAQQTLNEESGLLCNAFTWADIGFMGGLWVILALTQSYFVYCTRKYGKSQVKDHKLYHSVYSENPEAFTMSILQSKRYNGTDSVMWTNSMVVPGGPRDDWDARPSYESGRHEPGPEAGGAYYNHARGYSDGREAYGYGDSAAGAPGPSNPYAFNAPGGGYVDPVNPATMPGPNKV
ncbi:hypothetical protein CC85DRAFT_246365 [Cutaneotrichosporon oleaginosum]|uniref:Uncharacterized protein n=1 Tax=Cutaneotrichosporon oleaginosum TaxID=879819 RepID=A0A0J0XM72_9TREE|nr:uncharacterized protein CC85DRAFT_246365 [Cutaneotrichosporon oleaginosum]KLT42220.1 hypothetical protein CC85DRAFT_246365 [Cutaneotrichosporon oleaginosum]TXT11661.1 hypothetical protein COLE_02071 [Cutaneotrichosporon oleaginosum]